MFRALCLGVLSTNMFPILLVVLCVRLLPCGHDSYNWYRDEEAAIIAKSIEIVMLHVPHKF